MKCNYNGCSSKCKGDIDVESCNVLRAYRQGRADAIDELFNTPMEEFGDASLKEVFEEECKMPFDEGWNVCYENFLLIAEKLKEQSK